MTVADMVTSLDRQKESLSHKDYVLFLRDAGYHTQGKLVELSSYCYIRDNEFVIRGGNATNDNVYQLGVDCVAVTRVRVQTVTETFRLT